MQKEEMDNKRQKDRWGKRGAFFKPAIILDKESNFDQSHNSRKPI